MRIIVFAFRPRTKQVNFTASSYCIRFILCLMCNVIFFNIFTLNLVFMFIVKFQLLITME